MAKNAENKRRSELTKPKILSSELADIVGKKIASQTQCIMQIWTYVKKNKLQNFGTKHTTFNPDKKLAKIFGYGCIHVTGMSKFLNAHLS